MNDFGVKLVEAIASRIIDGDSLDAIKLPEPFGILRWTGWKSHPYSMQAHAQIIWYMHGSDYVFYVDLPSMQHGKVKKGEMFDVALLQDISHYIDEFTTVEDMRRWFKEGFLLLLIDVLNDNQWLIQPPERR